MMKIKEKKKKKKKKKKVFHVLHKNKKRVENLKNRPVDFGVDYLLIKGKKLKGDREYTLKFYLCIKNKNKNKKSKIVTLL
ncbi:unnamed protein product [marine sediment metagenome]|uniref:Uncharacterized protein n=1 Tax=marine sediment metagenome TaxID=412755 RepID=X1BG25_9ZZZZ